MNDDGTLRRRVREAIDTGKLPDRSPVGVWGGPGCGASCAICGERIGVDEIGFELEFSAGDELGWLQAGGNGLNGHSAGNGARSNGNGNGHGPHANGSGNGKDNLHMHLRCHAAWDLARQEVEHTQASVELLSARDDHGTMSSREREPRPERGSE